MPFDLHTPDGQRKRVPVIFGEILEMTWNTLIFSKQFAFRQSCLLKKPSVAVIKSVWQLSWCQDVLGMWFKFKTAVKQLLNVHKDFSIPSVSWKVDSHTVGFCSFAAMWFTGTTVSMGCLGLVQYFEFWVFRIGKQVIWLGSEERSQDSCQNGGTKILKNTISKGWED